MANLYHGTTKQVSALPDSVGGAVTGVVKAPFTLVGKAFNIISHPFRSIQAAWFGIRHPGQVAEDIFTKAAPDVDTAARNLGNWQVQTKANPHFAENLKEAARDFNKTIANDGMANKKLGGSLSTLWHNLQIDVLRRNPANVGSTHIPKDIAAVVEKTGAKAGLFERVLSKPVRIAANHPIAATLVAGAAALYGAVHWFRGRDAQATMEEMQTQAAMQQAAMGNQYMNSVSPAEMALLNSRLREGGKGNSFGDTIQASRAAAQAPGQA